MSSTPSTRRHVLEGGDDPIDVLAVYGNVDAIARLITDRLAGDGENDGKAIPVERSEES